MQGYLRSDGRKGIRNVIVVAYLVECAHHVAREIVARFPGQPVHLIGFPGCFPNAYASKIMRAICTHPNVGGALLVSLGCESFDRANLAKTIKESGRPVGLQDPAWVRRTPDHQPGRVRAQLQGRPALHRPVRAAQRRGDRELNRKRPAAAVFLSGSISRNGPLHRPIN